MNYFLIGLGIVFCTLGMVAYLKVDKLERQLKEIGILDPTRDQKRK